MDNLLDSQLKNLTSIFKHYNFEFIDYNDLKTNKSQWIFDLVKFNYIYIVDFLLKNEDININDIRIILIIKLLNEITF